MGSFCGPIMGDCLIAVPQQRRRPQPCHAEPHRGEQRDGIHLRALRPPLRQRRLRDGREGKQLYEYVFIGMVIKYTKCGLLYLSITVVQSDPSGQRPYFVDFVLGVPPCHAYSARFAAARQNKVDIDKSKSTKCSRQPDGSPCITNRDDSKSQVSQYFCTADFWSSLGYEAAEQKPKH